MNPPAKLLLEIQAEGRGLFRGGIAASPVDRTSNALATEIDTPINERL
jgi:hypothetical protein